MFSLKTGKEISGILVEIGRDHVTVEKNGNQATIMVEMIGAWEILKDEPVTPGERAARVEPPTSGEQVYAQYRSRSEEIAQTPVNNFSIRLYSEEEFQEIENPYAAYAEGGVVGEPEMFY